MAKKTAAASKYAWDQARADILTAIDVQAEYLSWGVRLSGEPNDEGWISCFALGREDSNPSAGINVGDGPLRGRYRDFGDPSPDNSMSFWYAAAKFGGHADHMAAQRHYAAEAKITLPSNEDSRDWSTQIEFQKWLPPIAIAYGKEKPPITPDALERMGAKRGQWPKNAKHRHTIFALPIYGPLLTESDPTGWVVVNAYGKKLEVYQGEGKPTTSEKSHTLRASKSGLMNRFALQHIAAAEVIWKVEGVTDCLALESMIPEEFRGRHVVITNSAGASERPRPEFLTVLAGKDVRVIHDADEPGQVGAKVWVTALTHAGATSRNVEMPFTISDKHGQDLRDYFNSGKTYQDLLDLAEQTKPIEKSEVKEDSDHVAETEICNLIQLDVLGEHDDGRIRVYSKKRKKVVTIRDINRLQLPQLIQICGSPARDNVTEKGDENKWELRVVRESIAMLAGQRQIDDGSMLGQGCWPIDDHAICIVNGGRAAVWNGSKVLEPNESPVCRGKLLDLANTEPWVDFDRLSVYLNRAASTEWCSQQIAQAIDIFRRWKWKGQHDPELVVGLIMATFMQVCFEWRPQVALMGESGTGKTTLFQFLVKLFGKLNVSGEKPSEAGLRQAIGNSSKAILLDEFEHDKHRQSVLELIRTASRGESSAILRGSQDQRGKRFALRHICWVAAIEIGLKRDPDRNRFVQLELVKPPIEEQGKLTLPSSNEAHDLGLRLLAVAVESIWKARDMATQLRGRYGATPDRVVESYSVPVAMLMAASGISVTDARAWMTELLDGGDFEETMMSDQDELVDAILSADVWVERGKETVGRILSGETADKPGAVTSLEGCGITRVSSGGDRSRRETNPWITLNTVFIAHRTVSQKLFRGSKWENQSLDQLLLRISGAKRGQRKISGRYSRGVEIPIEAFNLGKEDY
jgi:hypothetical protein